MPKERTLETEVGGYISTLLRKHFGKGPTSIYVAVNKPFIIIHFRGFTTTMEKILLKQNEWKRVLDTRNLLVDELKPMIRQQLKELGGWAVEEFYVDWNLALETGTFLGIMEGKTETGNFSWPSTPNKKLFDRKLEEICKKAQCSADQSETYWINERTLLIRWTGVLSALEKALIREGYLEVLKFTKRPLEKSWLQNAGLEAILERDIQEIFLDWDFDSDTGYVILLLQGKKMAGNSPFSSMKV